MPTLLLCNGFTVYVIVVIVEQFILIFLVYRHPRLPLHGRFQDGGQGCLLLFLRNVRSHLVSIQSLGVRKKLTVQCVYLHLGARNQRCTNRVL